jgi:hypothetical protein
MPDEEVGDFEKPQRGDDEQQQGNLIADVGPARRSR